MDDPGLSWPAWKFGLKRDDLHTKLHDQYNTFSYSIQDPEAFHHDVYEISNDADSSEDFHRMMADRQQQRIRELHESLESVSVEIIANPKLMATEQWQHALQLFRTRSFDSIVRFFASYIPEDYLDRHDQLSSSSLSSFSKISSIHTPSTKTSSVDHAQCPVYADTDYSSDVHDTADELCYSNTNNHLDLDCVGAPLSPPETEDARSEVSVSSPADIESQGSAYTSTNPPSRSMSFSGSESAFDPNLLRRTFTYETSQSDDCDTVATSVSDCAEIRSSIESLVGDDMFACEEDEDEFPPAQYPEDDFDTLDTLNDTPESDTPTPRQEPSSCSYIEYKSVISQRLPSPLRRSHSPKPQNLHRGDLTSVQGIRRSPEEMHNKIQKPSSDPIRKRPKGRI